jgi:5'(3')-deoxyribonucleotidase
MRKKLLSDVDGCAVDLMGDGPDNGGFCGYIWDRYGRVMRQCDITRFYIQTSPELQELHQDIDVGRAFNDFMAVPDVYQRYSRVMPGAKEALLLLNTRLDVLFITSVEAFPDSYASKHRFLNEHFPGIPIMAIPSRLKYGYQGDWGVDDRYDTCQSWLNAGCSPFLFRAPWNEAPPDTCTFDWMGITKTVEAFLDLEEHMAMMVKKAELLQNGGL